MPVSLRLIQHICNLALGVDCAPDMDHAPVDFQIGFVQVRSLVRSGAALAQMSCDRRPKMVHSAPEGLAGDNDPVYRQQIFDDQKD